MELRVLGDVEAKADGVACDLGRRVERVIFGLLAVNVGTTLSVDALTDLVWGLDPPARPRRAIQVAVSRLRACLTAVDAERRGVRLVTAGRGYRLDADAATAPT
ncbi:AfsR/SARP family transcriptional regulator [Actinokineospora sp. HUAS TT18]|uniref:AfsR/SARP family transcriptional regulator n=1 Tax=Actinokineospora sp. HUAS TT18 TaxID=3447451 RepID=UPI003F526E91